MAKHKETGKRRKVTVKTDKGEYTFLAKVKKAR